VSSPGRSLAFFFAASLALHASVLLSWQVSAVIPRHEETIQVAIFPESREPIAKTAPAPAPQPFPRRAQKPPAIIAKKNSPAPAPAPSVPRSREAIPAPEPAVEKEPSVEPPPRPEPPPENSILSERRLPTLRQLLPPVTYSSEAKTRGTDAPVSLNTSDPTYVTYVTRVRQSIEVEWQYPEVAKRYGLQGKLALEFTILGNGQLQGLRLIRSSGSALLDEEGLRAIQAAAPFPPIPPWIKPNPLPISATMEYRDSRLDYRFTR
jgi:protein TonB